MLLTQTSFYEYLKGDDDKDEKQYRRRNHQKFTQTP